MSAVRVHVLVHDGPHGVAVFGRDLAAATGAPTIALAALDGPRARVHTQFTDRLWADSPEEAAARFVALARRHALSVTLHDVPQPSDGARSLPRRRAAYAAVCRAARAVAVNSAHEAALLREHVTWDGPVAVIPLPVPAAVPPGPRPPGDGAVAVLGYFYPGKGHDEALAAAAAAGAASLAVLGRASDGHEGDLAAFARRGDDVGVAVTVSGWLDDDAMAARARAASVPVIAHRHVSASGSLTSWIGWGRRPIALRNRYVDEMAALRPGTIAVVDDDPGALAWAVRAALTDPAATWHGQERVAFGPAEAAEAYRRWWSA